MNESVLDTAVRSHAAGNALWACELIGALEAYQPGEAFRWVLTSARRLLPFLRDGDLKPLERDLDRLSDLQLSGSLSADELLEESRRVWYRLPSRDTCQTSVARLYAALAALRQGSITGYQRELAAAMAVLSTDERFTGDRLRQLLDGLRPVAAVPAQMRR